MITVATKQLVDTFKKLTRAIEQGPQGIFYADGLSVNVKEFRRALSPVFRNIIVSLGVSFLP